MAIDEGSNASPESQTDDGEGAPDESGSEGADGGTQAAGSEPAKPSRRERRNDFVRMTKEEAADAKRAAQEERDARVRLEAQVAELRRSVSERPSQPAQPDTRLAEARRKYELAIAMGSQSKTTEEAKHHLALMHEAQDEIQDIRAEAREKKLREELRESMPNPAMQTEAAIIAAEFPWIRENDEARSYADAKFNRLVRQGRPQSRETMREALTATAKELSLGGRSAPPESSRRAYEGTGAREGEGGGGSGPKGITVDQVRENAALKKLALSAYKHMEPDAAIARWVQRVGSKLERGGTA